MDGQLNMFDILGIEQKTELKQKTKAPKKEVPTINIDDIPKMPLSMNIRYDGEEQGLKRGTYYKGRYEIVRYPYDKNNNIHINVHLQIVTGKNRNGKEEGYGLIKTYKSIPHLLKNWYLPSLRDWVNEQVELILEAKGYEGVSTLHHTPYCVYYDGYYCNIYAMREQRLKNNPYSIENRKCRGGGPGCCKFCSDFGKCGSDCRVPCDKNSINYLLLNYNCEL